LSINLFTRDNEREERAKKIEIRKKMCKGFVGK